MADPNFKKISLMTEKTTVADTDFIPIVDTLEQADAKKNKKITTANLRKDITNAELAGAITAAKIAGLSTDPNADCVVFWDDSATSLAFLAPSTGLQIIDTTPTTTLTTKDSEIVHDNLSGYDANKHVDHTAITITAGAGLTGTGNLATSHTIAMSHLGIESLADPGADRIGFWDDSASKMDWLIPGAGLTIDNKTINAGVGTNELAPGSVTNPIIRDSAALSVIGRSANSAGDVDDIAAGTDGHVLRRSGTGIGFGTIANAGMAANSIDSDQYVDGSIDTAHIGDAQVTPAKTSFFDTMGASAAIYAGYVGSNGTTASLPSGWSSARNSTGSYTITHGLNTLQYFAFFDAFGQNLVIGNVQNQAENSITVVMFSTATGNPIDTGVNFILIRYSVE